MIPHTKELSPIDCEVMQLQAALAPVLHEIALGGHTQKILDILHGPTLLALYGLNGKDVHLHRITMGFPEEDYETALDLLEKNLRGAKTQT